MKSIGGRIYPSEEVELLSKKQEAQLQELELSFKEVYGEDFNMDKVLDKLLYLDTLYPSYAKEHFNPLGLLEIYCRYFKKDSPHKRRKRVRRKNKAKRSAASVVIYVASGANISNNTNSVVINGSNNGSIVNKH